jgi:catechol 2,3-dioxygenase-like lactoylglutathione lyase family enzyme
MAVVTLRLHHVSVIVTDLARSAAFYRELFGFEPIERPPFPIPGLWLGVGSLQVHLVVYPPGNFRTRGVDNDDIHFAFNTDDFEGFVAQAHAMGFSENAPPDDPKRLILKRQGMAGFPQVYLLDPDHNIIEVNGAPSAAGPAAR